MTPHVTSHLNDTFPNHVPANRGYWTIVSESNIRDENNAVGRKEELAFGPDLELTVGAEGSVEGQAVFRSISYETWDSQGLAGAGSINNLTVNPDDRPPTFEGSPSDMELPCPSGGPQIIEPPTATDSCSEPTVSGVATGTDGTTYVVPPSGVVNLPSGSFQVVWTAVDEEGNISAPATQTVVVRDCLVAAESMSVNNEVRLFDASGEPMSVTNAGSGTTHVGGRAMLGTVTARGDVQIDGQATVTGDVIAGGSVVVQAGAAVSGVVKQHQALSLPAPQPISGTFPSSCGGPVRFNAGLPGVQHLAPGCYSELALGSRTVLQLEGGLYSFGSVTIEPDGVLVTPSGLAVDVLGAVTFRGKLRTPSGAPGFLDLRARTSGQVVLEAALHARVLAPQGTLILGGNNGQIYRGSFDARRIELRAGIEFRGTGELPPGYELLALSEPGAVSEGEFEDIYGEEGCAFRPVQRSARHIGGPLLFLLILLGTTLRRRRFS